MPRYLRLVEMTALALLGAFLLYSLITPLDPDRRVEIYVFLATASAYVAFFLHYAFVRFMRQGWFHYLQTTFALLLALEIGLILPEIIPALDLLLALGVISAAVLGGRRLSLYVALVSSALMLALSSTYAPDSAAGLVTLLRVVVFGGLAVLVCAVMDRIAEQGQEALLAAEQQKSQLEALHELASIVGSSLDFQEVLQLALDKTLQALSMDAGLVALLDKDERELQVSAQRGFTEETARQIMATRLSVGQGLAGLAVAERRPTFSEDMANDPRVVMTNIRNAGFRSYISIPLNTDAKVFGVLSVVARARHSPDDQELAFLQAIGRQVGLAVQRAQLYEQATRRLNQLSALNEVAHGITSPLEMTEVLQTVYEQVVRLTNN
ncbi:MAG: GAF domain-containing protein, partial [Chloroflexi bacterium]|nr:GAF domain-containing protein [Chloroflexota bacterium]